MLCRFGWVAARVAVIIVVVFGVGTWGCGDEGPGTMPDAGPEVDSAVPLLPTADYIFDMTRLHRFELEVAPADWQKLHDEALLEQYVPATMIFEGTRYEKAAVRFKGAWNSLTACFVDGEQVCPKLSIKISFNEYGHGRFAGMRKLILNSSVRDPSLMHDVTGYWLYRAMGLHAPRASHAMLTVNGEDQGLFVLVENIDKEFVEDHFTDETGNLFKSVWPQGGNAPERYIDALRTNEDVPDISGMLALEQLVNSTTDQTFASDFAGVIDLSYMTRFLAVDRAINNADGSGRFYCFDYPGWQVCRNNNFYLYDEPGGVFHLIPWDLDHALYDVNDDLGRGLFSTECAVIPACTIWGHDPCPADEISIGIMPTQCDALSGHIHRSTWSDYVAALDELEKGPLAAEKIGAMLAAEREKIRAAVAADPFGPGMASWQESNDWLDVVLSRSRAAIRALVAESQTP